MRISILLLSAVIIFAACKDKNGSAKKGNPPADAAYLVSKNGIGDIKVGMSRTEIEKLLKQPLVMMHAKDTGEIWSDTAIAKYRDAEVTLCFQKMYSETPTDEMELISISTKSDLCKTSGGIGIGDDRNAVLAAYEDQSISMGPESIMINDTTWGLSKTNYYITVNDSAWDKQITFSLINKKIASIEASIQMGD